MKKLTKNLALGAALSLAVGCGTSIDGEEGNLSFRYLGSDLVGGVSDGNLAVGARIDVEVRAAATEDQEAGESALALEEAYSESADVIDVVDQQNLQFTMEAKSAGSARITAAARVDDEEVSDTVEIRAAEVAGLEFRSRCGDDDVFVTDSGAVFGYRMDDVTGNKLTGYGYYPVSVEPAVGGTVRTDTTEVGVLELTTGAEAGMYELVSDVDDTRYGFQLVAPEEITAVNLEQEGEDLSATVQAGSEVAVALFTMEADGKAVCGPARGAVEITTSSPEICEPSYRFLSSLHLVYVEGLSEGECTVSLSVGDGSLERDFTVTVN